MDRNELEVIKSLKILGYKYLTRDIAGNLSELWQQCLKTARRAIYGNVDVIDIKGVSH